MIQGTFNTGRTDVAAEMTGLNNFLGILRRKQKAIGCCIVGPIDQGKSGLA